MSSLKERMEAAAKEHGMNGSDGFFSFKVSGAYTFRVLTEPLEMATHFFGKGRPGSVCYKKGNGCPFHGSDAETPSVKFQCYILDRADQKVKLAELPWSVVSVLSEYEVDPDWSFDHYPMPYDIRVNYDKENKDKKSIYKTIGVPRREELTVEEENASIKKQDEITPAKYIRNRQEKQMVQHKEEGIWLDEAAREELERKRLEEGTDVAQQHPAESSGESIQYPSEEINPEDIPF